jgi:hypothetical protein
VAELALRTFSPDAPCSVLRFRLLGRPAGSNFKNSFLSFSPASPNDYAGHSRFLSHSCEVPGRREKTAPTAPAPSLPSWLGQLQFRGDHNQYHSFIATLECGYECNLCAGYTSRGRRAGSCTTIAHSNIFLLDFGTSMLLRHDDTTRNYTSR